MGIGATGADTTGDVDAVDMVDAVGVVDAGVNPVADSPNDVGEVNGDNGAGDGVGDASVVNGVEGVSGGAEGVNGIGDGAEGVDKNGAEGVNDGNGDVTDVDVADSPDGVVAAVVVGATGPAVNAVLAEDAKEGEKVNGAVARSFFFVSYPFVYPS